jgi:hypothetical protein
MDMMRRRAGTALLCALLALAGGCDQGTRSGTRQVSGVPQLRFSQPLPGQLSLVGSIAVELSVAETIVVEDLEITLDGSDVTRLLTVTSTSVSGELTDVAAGTHRLTAQGKVAGRRLSAATRFETVMLENPAECEVLNNAACLLPYPSSRFLQVDGTRTGYRVRFPVAAMPRQSSEPLNPTPYSRLDGFSPAVQILMHFPAGVDLVASDVSRLLDETRTFGLRSLEPDSPTVLIDADTGERVLHFAELDSWAEGLPARQVLYLHPARALTPTHRYIVAARNLVSPDGKPVEAEPVFAALRDGRPSTVGALESRRTHFESVFAKLERAGISRPELVLAFDFVVESDEVLAEEMLAMRDQAVSWLDLRIEAGAPTFAIDRVGEGNCADSATFAWRVVEGTFEAPLFLDSDPIHDPFRPGTLNSWLDEVPVAFELMDAPFTIAIPCTVLRNGGTPTRAVLIGHDAYETGEDAISFISSIAGLDDLELIFAATDWLGQTRNDQVFALIHLTNANAVPALVDRQRQAQINGLLLAHMIKRAVFNDDPTFQTPEGVGVFAGPEDELYYAGRGIGADYGLVLAALSPDIDKAYIDLPMFSESLGLRRSVQYPAIEALLQLTGVYDPMETALLFAVRHELEVRAWPGPYLAYAEAGHPLRKTKRTDILMTAAWLDQTTTDLGAEIVARTLGLPNLRGSCRQALPGIDDQPGPLSSAVAFYDTGSYDPDNPEHGPFIPREPAGGGRRPVLQPPPHPVCHSSFPGPDACLPAAWRPHRQPLQRPV